MGETDRELVRQYHPLARAEWIGPTAASETGASHGGYWVVRGGEGATLGTGPTREAAWAEAASRIRAGSG